MNYPKQPKDRFIVEFRFRKKNNDWLWIMGRGVIVERDQEGQPLRFVGTHTDISRQKQTEEKLLNSELEKETILDSLVEHVIYQDPEMNIVWPNKAACDSVGSGREELIGRHCFEIWCNESKPCMDCPVLKAMKTGESHELEKETPDGRYWYIRGHPARDKAGKIIGGIEVTLEITERRMAEAELKAKNEEYIATNEELEESLIRIRSKNRTPPALAFTSDWSRNAMKWGNLLGVPLLFILFGIFRVTGRRRRAEARWKEALP